MIREIIDIESDIEPPIEPLKMLYISHAGALINDRERTVLAFGIRKPIVPATMPIIGSNSRIRFFTVGSLSRIVNVAM